MEARQPFSRLGWALFAQMAVMLAAQWGVLLLARAARPGLLGEPVFLWAASVLGAYGLGIPAACLVLRGTAAPPAPARRPLGPVRFATLWAGSVGLACLANGATLLLTGLLGRLRGAAMVNPVESIGLYPLPFQLLLAGLIAPAAEELLFRRLLLRRLRPYGERFALVASALCFGLFHGNLNQFFYAFLLGLVLAELALSTGCLWQAVLLHALVNLFSILWGWLGGPVVVTGVLMLAGAMVPFRLIPAL
ncbi:MAG: lysostaphin resistance A-like protein, partial [Flavonifractor plautii]